MWVCVCVYGCMCGRDVWERVCGCVVVGAFVGVGAFVCLVACVVYVCVCSSVCVRGLLRVLERV